MIVGGASVSYDFGTLDFGNALRISAKRDAYVQVDFVNGHSVDFSAGILPAS
jgi:hypothetical protein